MKKLFHYTLFIILVSSCTKDKGKVGNGYPEEISKILADKCATAGCHTQKSKDAAAGLAMETWDQLFEGDRNGAVCIPYRHDYSTIFLFTNTDNTLGAVNSPTMPLNKPALTKEEMNTLIDWIDKGAPNSEGKIAFADNTNRKKIYVTNQGCNVVTVFDAATQLQMRYIDVGNALTQTPHMIKVSPDGKYWYVSFLSGKVFQKFNTSDDLYIGDINIGSGSWNTFAITNDSKKAFVVDWQSTGKVTCVDLQAMTKTIDYSGIFNWPHGSGIKGNMLYVTHNQSNYLYKTDITDPLNPDFKPDISLDGTPPNSTQLFPHDLAFSPDSLYYYVTCEKENTVRVFQASDDSFIAAIATGVYPLELAFSKTTPYLFVTCEQDLTPPETNRGCVDVIDYTAKPVPTWIKRLRLNMSEPHGIGVDDEHGLVYVANRNKSGASVPHHSTKCGGKNGFISFIDLNTREVIPDKKIEVAVDPYSIAVK